MQPVETVALHIIRSIDANLQAAAIRRALCYAGGGGGGGGDGSIMKAL